MKGRISIIGLAILIVSLFSIVVFSSPNQSSFNPVDHEYLNGSQSVESISAEKVGNSIIIPYTTNGLEIQKLQTFMTDNGWVYVREFDPYMSVNVTPVSPLEVQITIASNSNIPSLRQFENMEICTHNEADLLTNVTSTDPVNCIGNHAYKMQIEHGVPFSIFFNEEYAHYDWYIGEGAGGGGGIGCTPGWEVLELITSASSPQNTETEFDHSATVTIEQGDPGGSCAITYYHKPSTQFTAYTTSYPSSFSNSVAKISSGNTTNPIEVTSTGTYTKKIKCGGKHGTLSIQVKAGTLTSNDSVTCDDFVSPVTNLSSPADGLAQFTASNVTFLCNGTDNTNLDIVELWGLWNGWHLNQTVNFTDTTAKNQSFEKSLPMGNWTWNCRYFDTKSTGTFGVNRTIIMENETEGRQAIVDAINAAIPEMQIYTDQQIYVVDAQGNQGIGKFDKVAILGNQTWAFNYRSGNETFASVPSLLNVVNTWQNQSLTEGEIRNQIELFINGTKI